VVVDSNSIEAVEALQTVEQILETYNCLYHWNFSDEHSSPDFCGPDHACSHSYDGENHLRVDVDHHSDSWMNSGVVVDN
jgi:hypothetical protein